MADVDRTRPPSQWKPLVADRGRRRHLSYSMDFDSRALLLEDVNESWSEDVKHAHIEGRERTKQGLASEFGLDFLDAKVENFMAIGLKPFSIVAHHNAFFEQVRRSFVIGAYYPSLIGACALGERILNHLVLDLRDSYTHTPEYRLVSRKDAFANWNLAIDALVAWDVLLPTAAEEFRALMVLRHRSIHFNVSTYETLREDSLAAICHLREIIGQQFCVLGPRPWFIDGTKGFVFIKQGWEENPFIKAYYLPTCPFVGPYFSISFENGLAYHDHSDYGDGDWSDKEFASAFASRLPEDLAKHV